MTVRELIAHLQTLPQDFEVAYRQCSDSSALEAEQITVITAEQKKIVRHHNMSDRLRDYAASDYSRGVCLGITPEFLNVVMFPGN